MRPKKMGRAQTGVSILTGITKSRFSRFHRSVIFYPKNTKFAVEVPAYNRKLHNKPTFQSWSWITPAVSEIEWPKFRVLFFMIVFFFFFLLRETIINDENMFTGKKNRQFLWAFGQHATTESVTNDTNMRMARENTILKKIYNMLNLLLSCTTVVVHNRDRPCFC